MNYGPTKCRNCGKRHNLRTEAAGSGREVERLCSTCFRDDIEQKYDDLDTWGSFCSQARPMKFEQIKSHWYDTWPTISFGFRQPCPYVWMLWWLITWETKHDRQIDISISYLPD